MHDALTVGIQQRAGHLPQDVARLVPRHRAFANEGGEFGAAQLLHDNKERGVGPFAIEDLDNVVVAKFGNGLRFLLKAFGEVPFVHQLMRQHFDRDRAMECGVIPLVDDGPSAAPELAEEVVFSHGSQAAGLEEALAQDFS